MYTPGPFHTIVGQTLAAQRVKNSCTSQQAQHGNSQVSLDGQRPNMLAGSLSRARGSHTLPSSVIPVLADCRMTPCCITAVLCKLLKQPQTPTTLCIQHTWSLHVGSAVPVSSGDRHGAYGKATLWHHWYVITMHGHMHCHAGSNTQKTLGVCSCQRVFLWSPTSSKQPYRATAARTTAISSDSS